MDGKESSIEGKVIPAGWATYNPEEPPYEVRHLCVYLSNLDELFSTNPTEDPEKEDP